MTFVANSTDEFMEPAQRSALMRRAAIVGSPDKPAAARTLPRLRDWLARRVEVSYAEVAADGAGALATQPDVLFVLGGDGTLISVVSSLGVHQIPIVGVNHGKLGFMADFTIEELERSGEFLFRAALPVTRRLMLDVRMENGEAHFRAPAVNDCAIHAGAPFRMVELRVEVDGDEVARMRGDGLIVSTPSGSTAHNLAAGGPILEPTASSIILTPLCPHALTFRPIVLDAGRTIRIHVNASNPGTHTVVDGRNVWPYHDGDRVTISRYPADFLLVRNPQHTVWHALRRKLMWGTPPALSSE